MANPSREDLPDPGVGTVAQQNAKLAAELETIFATATAALGVASEFSLGPPIGTTSNGTVWDPDDVGQVFALQAASGGSWESTFTWPGRNGETISVVYYMGITWA